MNATSPTDSTFPPAEWNDLTIHQRIALVQAAVGVMTTDAHVSIRGEKANYDFDYITKSALLMRARVLFTQIGVAVLISEDGIEQSGNRTRVTMRVTLACSAAGGVQEASITRSAYGNDPFDKGPQKAGTTAVRIALGDLLMQGGGDVDEQDAVEFREHVHGQALQDGERPATVDQLKFACDLVMKAHLDKAMPTAQHAILRLARAVCQHEIGPGLEVEDAIRLIPSAAISKVIEKIEPVTPATAKMVWDRIAAWEVENGYSSSVDPEDTKIPDAAPLKNADGEDIPF